MRDGKTRQYLQQLTVEDQPNARSTKGEGQHHLAAGPQSGSRQM